MEMELRFLSTSSGEGAARQSSSFVTRKPRGEREERIDRGERLLF
jgi:hypothetical protein